MAKEKIVVDSTNLGAYKITKTAEKEFAEIKAMNDYMMEGGRQPPSYVRLKTETFDQVNRKVIEQSDKKHSARDVRWNGFSLKRGNEA